MLKTCRDVQKRPLCPPKRDEMESYDDIVDDYTAGESSASFLDLLIQFVARLLSGLGMPSIDPWRLLPAAMTIRR